MIRKILLGLLLSIGIAQAQTVTPAIPDISNLNCASLTNAAPSCSIDATNGANLTSGNIASARLSGAYSGITGLGTLASGAVPTTLLTGVVQTAQLSGANLTNASLIGGSFVGAKTTTTVVGSLPTCNSASLGTSYIVTDALLPVSLAIVGAGGAVVVRIFCNGTAWIVG